MSELHLTALRAAADLLARDDKIAWGVMAQARNGLPVMWEDERAARFNPLGAINHCVGALRLERPEHDRVCTKAKQVLADHLRAAHGHEGSQDFNLIFDWADDASAADIVEAMRICIQPETELRGHSSRDGGYENGKAVGT